MTNRGKGILDQHAGLYTDHYELAMAQGYLVGGMGETPACFDYLFRANPFQGGYVILAGLSDLLATLATLRFADEDCRYLRDIGFAPRFVEYLRGFSFKGDLHAPEEGEVVFPNEPLIRVEGTLIEAQIIETLLLNTVNFASLIATKASRIRQAAGDRVCIDFGLRRAQGLGGILASKAAVIGGMDSTSNVYSAFLYDLVSTGTQAHSWIQAHEDELTAFRNYAVAFPQRCVLLVDTYDTLRSGLPHAIQVGLEMAARGERLFAIRLDSGDLLHLSREARRMLDGAGLDDVRIVASNQLDEYRIRDLLRHGAPLDAFGVGTRLVTGVADAALDGVYKLAMSGGRPRLKISENLEKVILPGVKEVWRCLDGDGGFHGDCIGLAGEGEIATIHHPYLPGAGRDIAGYRRQPLCRKVMDKGQLVMEAKSVAESAAYARATLARLPAEHQRFEEPRPYPVGISGKLLALRDGMMAEIREKLDRQR